MNAFATRCATVPGFSLAARLRCYATLRSCTDTLPSACCAAPFLSATLRFCLSLSLEGVETQEDAARRGTTPGGSPSRTRRERRQPYWRAFLSCAIYALRAMPVSCAAAWGRFATATSAARAKAARARRCAQHCAAAWQAPLSETLVTRDIALRRYSMGARWRGSTSFKTTALLSAALYRRWWAGLYISACGGGGDVSLSGLALFAAAALL